MTGAQQNPAVAVAAGGEFVIVWQSYSGIDPSDSGVFGQRFDASGAKVGGEFQINEYTTGYQRNPRVAILTSGEFIVTWSSEQDEQSGAVMARAYAGDGTPIGGEFQVNTTELGAQYRPDVALDPFGQAIVVWQSFLQDGDGPGIYGQRLDLGGTKIGPEFSVNTYTTGTQRNPHVAAGPEGDFTVVWESFGNEGDPNSEAIVAQHFAGNGTRDQVETVAQRHDFGPPAVPAHHRERAARTVRGRLGERRTGRGRLRRLRPAARPAARRAGRRRRRGQRRSLERQRRARARRARRRRDRVPQHDGRSAHADRHAPRSAARPAVPTRFTTRPPTTTPCPPASRAAAEATDDCYEMTVGGDAPGRPLGRRPSTRRSRSTTGPTAGRCTSAAASPMCRRTPSIPSSRTSFTTALPAAAPGAATAPATA